MTIERIGPPDSVSNIKKTQKTQTAKKQQKTDSISVSAEARSKAEVYAATETTQKTPDVRLDRIEEVKKKLQDPMYLSDEVIEETAKKILDAFGL